MQVQSLSQKSIEQKCLLGQLCFYQMIFKSRPNEFIHKLIERETKHSVLTRKGNTFKLKTHVQVKQND